ncbi:Uncharacterised protein [Acinetobacter baumannii]|nr:Uncharacterised protein [Acinetobacter baumannii]
MNEINILLFNYSTYRVDRLAELTDRAYIQIGIFVV